MCVCVQGYEYPPRHTYAMKTHLKKKEKEKETFANTKVFNHNYRELDIHEHKNLELKRNTTLSQQ